MMECKCGRTIGSFDDIFVTQDDHEGYICFDCGRTYIEGEEVEIIARDEE